MSSLVTLYLNNNALESLPESLGGLESLVTLDLRNNANLSSLPASLLELSHLEPVSLAGTAICANGGAPALDSAFDDLIEAGVVYCEGACAPTCGGSTCDALSSEHGFSCAEIETWGCDCSGCSCPLDSASEGACAPTCNGYTCDEASEAGYYCSELENYGCDCSGCSCPLDSAFYSYSYSY